MAKTIMFQGTSSNVGKSILTTALCRILYNKGYKVAPFKAQNMSLNSYVTKCGDEIGRAQVAQAEAAGTEPIVQMNPVLLKPTGNMSSQVVLMGKPVSVFSARDYHTEYTKRAFSHIEESLSFLQKNYDIIVIEGAGSPAEVNLKKNDIVNMRVAKINHTPVILVADIDRGGAIASIIGTLALLEEDERELVKGIIINKFRGDITLLQPALDFIEEYTNKPVIGVIPYIDNIDIDEEDSVALESKKNKPDCPIHISILQTPKISNFTDFAALQSEPDVYLEFVNNGNPIGNTDLIIIPGSKNTLADLNYLRNNGYDVEIQAHVKKNKPLIGICGGYQMLGTHIYDPYHIEGNITHMEGLSLLPMSTTLTNKKETYQVEFLLNKNNIDCFENAILKGYEIHMGKSIWHTMENKSNPALFTIVKRGTQEVSIPEGLTSQDTLVWGTYIHGIFDNDGLRRFIINELRKKKGIPPIPIQFAYFERKENAYNRLAQVVEENLSMDKIQLIMEGKL